MGKKKSITLLTIVCVLMAAILVLTFARFPIGAVKEYNSALGAIELDYDIEGGVAYTLTLASDNEEEVEDVNVVINTLKERINALGYGAYSIKALKNADASVLDYDIRIELKNSETVESDIAAIAAYGELKFYGGSEEDPTTQVLEDIDVVVDSQYVGMQAENDHVISIVFKSEAKNKLVELINAQESYYLKITCGEDEHGHETALFNASITADAFNGDILWISGIGTEEDAQRMALQVRSGGLAYKYEISDGVVVSSPYGEDVALKCTVAVITLVAVLMVLYIVLYRGLGVIASLATLLFIMFETWLMLGVPGITLTLGGVIGIIASTIICALGMIVLAQRIKDEYANSQKTVKAAVDKGFRTSLVPTINVHVIAGVVALLVLAFASGALKNFAVTFGIGVAVSLICALVFTRMFTALIMPLVKNKEKFLRFKRADAVNEIAE